MTGPVPPLRAVPTCPELPGFADPGVDLDVADIDAHLDTTAYQAALGTTAAVVTASLLDFLR